ncbi:MAG: prenyltransferase [Actinobacteria bacterium]|nr:prenyltransferase [Actinomycetota bacterium]
MGSSAAAYRGNTIKNIFIMSRPPFHIVGIMPFVLGTVMAHRINGVFDLAVFLIALFAVIMIMLLTYYNGEYYDVKEDRLAAALDKNTFSGGSQVIAQNALPKKYARTGSFIALGIAVAAGLLLQFYFKTGIWTIAFGVLGIFLGFFYSNPPFRWVSRGVGEIFIGFCYGWLPVTVAYYIQTQKFNPLVNWVTIPIALTIFNVILINEFPDYTADIQTGKRNIVVRLGVAKSRFIYIASAILTWVFFGVSIYRGAPLISLYCAIPFLLISVFTVLSLLRKNYMEHKKLEMLCGMTIVVNIGISLAYIIGIATGL